MKLTLKKELLTELTADELRAVVGADAETQICWVKTLTQWSVCSLC